MIWKDVPIFRENTEFDALSFIVSSVVLVYN